MKQGRDSEGGSRQVGPGAGVQGRGAHLRRQGRVPKGVGRAALGPREGEGCEEQGSGSAKRMRGGGQPGLRPGSGAGGQGARLGRPPAPGAPPGTYHLGDLEAAERAAQVVGVAAQAGQPAALAHRLGGGLVRAAGARNHGGARGLALEAVQLLAAPHAAARPGPPRAAGPRRPELVGSAGSPHHRGRRRLTHRPRPAPPPLPLRPPPAAAAARSARARLPPPRQRKGKEAGAGGEGRRREPEQRAGRGRSERLPAAARRRWEARERQRWQPAPPALGAVRPGPALTCPGAG